MMLKFTRERADPIYIRHDQIVSFHNGQYGHWPTYLRTTSGQLFEVLEKSDEIVRMIEQAEARAGEAEKRVSNGR